MKPVTHENRKLLKLLLPAQCKQNPVTRPDLPHNNPISDGSTVYIAFGLLGQ